MSSDVISVELPSTAHQRTLDIVLRSALLGQVVYLAGKSLRRKQDMLTVRPYTLGAQLKNMATLGISYYSLTRQVAVLDQRRWAGIKLLQRHSNDDHTVQNVLHLVSAPAGMMVFIHRLRRGRTYIGDYSLTQAGRRLDQFRIANQAYFFTAAAIELYVTRNSWLPGVDRRITSVTERFLARDEQGRHRTSRQAALGERDYHVDDDDLQFIINAVEEIGGVMLPPASLEQLEDYGDERPFLNN